MPVRLVRLEVARMRGTQSGLQLARRRLTLASARANQRPNLVDVSSACRGELQRRGGPTGMCNTASPPSPPFSLSLSLSLSFFRSCALHATSSNLYFRLDRELVEARGPLFYRPIRTLLNLNLLRSSANRRLAAHVKNILRKNARF